MLDGLCPYLLISDDDTLIQYCREKIQLSTHLLQETDYDLLEPCLIHAICESAKSLKGSPITPRQKRILRNSLWSRCLTRFIPVNLIATLCKEFSF